uniref:Uncharacterized protein n=1 Tax=Siphoviridae sp. ctBeL15 TaxID=2825374 RepID=A0A8S5V057_9CAUD|nr:MAG TPA: hypothetical protein [Siphoviridae sp. ctBeL15]
MPPPRYLFNLRTRHTSSNATLRTAHAVRSSFSYKIALDILGYMNYNEFMGYIK